MKRITHSLLSLVVAVVLVSAAPAGAATPIKDWTYMVFMNADNNLDSYADEDWGEMMKVGSSDWLNIVTLTDRENGPGSLHYIEKGNNVKVKDLGELDMGDYKLLVQFAKDVHAAYPARHYVISIWNHGSGWKNAGKPLVKGISYDDSTGNHITTAQLGQAMREIKAALGRNVDLLSMDACLMQMMEVTYEVRQSVDFVVASEETEPGNGYPYDAHMAGFKPGTTPREYCRHMVQSFHSAYDGGVYGKQDTTQSAIDCAHLDALRDGLDGFAKAAMAGNVAAEFKQALGVVQKFDYRTNIDLGHLVALLKKSGGGPGMQTALARLEKAVQAAVVANATTGDAMKNATGLAIYFPSASYSFSNEYLNLTFARESLWDEMLKDYFQKITVTTVVGGLEEGDPSALAEYVRHADDDQLDLSRHLTGAVNFRLYSEGGLPESLRATAAHLLAELAAK